MIRLVGFNISGMPVASCQRASTSRRKIGRSLTRSTLRPEVPQDDDSLLALPDRPTLDCAHEIILAIERTGLSSEAETFLARDLRNGPTWREITTEDAVIHRSIGAGQTLRTNALTASGPSP